MSDLLPNVDVIYGDGTDKQLLEEEGIDDTDAFVSLTGIDEENIILSMYANTKDINKIVTKLSQSSFRDLTESFNLDTVVSPKDLTANIILRYVKAMNNSYGSKLNCLYRMVDDKVEALEFSVKDSCKIVDIPLSDLKLKKDILVACIVREGRIIIPNGNDSMRVKDNIIIISKELNISDIEDIVAE